jgi:hypothetical protein
MRTHVFFVHALGGFEARLGMPSSAGRGIVAVATDLVRLHRSTMRRSGALHVRYVLEAPQFLPAQ